MEASEDQTLRGYVLLVKQMLINVLDRIRIKDSWKRHPRNISKRMLRRKKAQLKDLGGWLETDGARQWFRMYGLCTGTVGFKIHRNFKKLCNNSQKFIDNLKHMKLRKVRRVKRIS